MREAPPAQGAQGAPQGGGQEQAQGGGGAPPEQIIDMVAAGITALMQQMTQGGVPEPTVKKLAQVGDMFMSVIDEAMGGGQQQQAQPAEGGAVPVEAGTTGKPMSPAGY